VTYYPASKTYTLNKNQLKSLRISEFSLVIRLSVIQIQNGVYARQSIIRLRLNLLFCIHQLRPAERMWVSELREVLRKASPISKSEMRTQKRNKTLLYECAALLCVRIAAPHRRHSLLRNGVTQPVVMSSTPSRLGLTRLRSATLGPRRNTIARGIRLLLPTK